MAMQGIFFLLAGPSAAGKTVVLNRLLEQSQGLVKNVSVTTRAPRAGEVDGRNYRFWQRAAFESEVAAGAFLEHAIVHGKDLYGTLKKDVTDELAAGRDVIKDIDVQGVEQVRRALPYPQSVAIFLVPPSREVLAERLRGRGTESAEAFERRMKSAEAELQRIGEYDYLVVNETVDATAAAIAAIRHAEHLRRSRNDEAFRKAWGL